MVNICSSLFFKNLELIIYSILYDYLTVNKVLFSKELVFRAVHWTKQALLELIGQIYDSFNNQNYFLGIFNDLPKAFDNVDRSILLKNWQRYAVQKGRNLSWFQSYLSSRKQYIDYMKDNKTGSIGLSDIKCRVTHGLIFARLLSMIYIYDNN